MEFAELLFKELEENYDCYGFGFTVNHVPDVYSPVITNNTAPPPISYSMAGHALEVKIMFRQAMDVDPSKEARRVLFDRNNPLGNLMSNSIRAINMHMGVEWGYNECAYEIDVYLGDEARLQELVKAIKHVEWRKYSKDFDTEIDKILTSS